MEADTEKTIISHLVYTEDYARRVIPYLKKEYFSDDSNAFLFSVIGEFLEKYGKIPSKEAILIDMQGRHGVNEKVYASAVDTISRITAESTDVEWLMDVTETYCRDRALYNALTAASEIVFDKKSKTLPSAIPEMLTNALSVSFDESIGHDYTEDAEARFESYHSKTNRVPFDIEIFNTITKGGLPDKTLTVIIASTGVGKTLIMGHQAAANLSAGKKVLYITLEMSAEKIAERIDANLLDVTLDELLTLSKEQYMEKIARMRRMITGRLIIKEYPPASMNSSHFKALIKELSVKKGFKPDIIYIDYINLCQSSRIKPSEGSYFVVKAIAEELRAIAVEHKCPVVTATQTTRTGMSSSDIDLTDTSESVGVPYTADLMYAVMSSTDLDRAGQYMVKQLKNRMNNPSKNSKFLVGVDKDKMRLYNLEEVARSSVTRDPLSTPGMPKPTLDLKDKLKRLK